MKEYINALRNTGKKIIESNDRYFWISYEKKSVARSPAFILDIPDPEEIKKIYSELNPVFITYNTPASEDDANAFLYVSNDHNYALENLDKNRRRDARIALRNLEFKFTDWDHILKYGFRAFSDTRTRNGLSDGTEENFVRIFTECKRNPAFKSLAAFEPGTDEICAFFQIIEVDDWVEITSSFSENESLKQCPNNGLFNEALKYYLAEGRANIVSYGVSSIQKDSNKDTLHDFKTRVGFEAKPVKREFVINPRYKPFINKFSHGVIKIFLSLFPRNRRIRKLDGVLSSILN